jgi:ribonuclease P protein component
MPSAGRETFPKSARLRKRPEFLKLSRTGQKIHSRNFVVIYQTSERDASRLGVTVSGKIGNAIVRNRIKRYVREAFRRHRRELESAFDLLVIAKKSACDVSSTQVEKELATWLGFRGTRKS